ncbi:hypothetical protein GW796_09030 [archaeon]|nr:hypothetical protein [archaeon]NCT58875.1 hypothetical protein [archaeon]
MKECCGNCKKHTGESSSPFKLGLCSSTLNSDDTTHNDDWCEDFERKE